MRRLLLLDVLRTIAIVLMVAYHFLFDLSYFWGFPFDVRTGTGWRIGIAATASLFLLVSGMSAWTAAQRNPSLKRAIRRALIVIGAALLISATTYVMDSERWIRFGILHLIGATLLIVPFFVRRSSIVTAAIGIACIVLGLFIKDMSTGHVWLLPLGIEPHAFVSLDYYPLFPWSGVLLLGIAVAPMTLTRFSQTYEPQSRWNFILFPGRRSLLIYLLHQPLLFLILRMMLGSPAAMA